MKSKLKKGDLAVFRKGFKFFAISIGLESKDIIIVEDLLECKYQIMGLSWPCPKDCIGKIKFRIVGNNLIRSQISCMYSSHGISVSKMSRLAYFLYRVRSKISRSKIKKEDICKKN